MLFFDCEKQLIIFAFHLHCIGNTFTAMSLEEILCQAVEQLGYYSTESGLAYTREGLYQSSYEFQNYARSYHGTNVHRLRQSTSS